MSSSAFLLLALIMVTLRATSVDSIGARNVPVFIASLGGQGTLTGYLDGVPMHNHVSLVPFSETGHESLSCGRKFCVVVYQSGPTTKNFKLVNLRFPKGDEPATALPWTLNMTLFTLNASPPGFKAAFACATSSGYCVLHDNIQYCDWWPGRPLFTPVPTSMSSPVNARVSCGAHLCALKLDATKIQFKAQGASSPTLDLSVHPIPGVVAGSNLTITKMEVLDAAYPVDGMVRVVIICQDVSIVGYNISMQGVYNATFFSGHLRATSTRVAGIACHFAAANSLLCIGTYGGLDDTFYTRDLFGSTTVPVNVSSWPSIPQDVVEIERADCSKHMDASGPLCFLVVRTNNSTHPRFLVKLFGLPYLLSDGLPYLLPTVEPLDVIGNGSIVHLSVLPNVVECEVIPFLCDTRWLDLGVLPPPLQDQCVDRIWGADCMCPPGFYSETSRLYPTCEDINECYGPHCASGSQCINTVGSFVCLSTCGDGIRYTATEECDDGNSNENDGCTSACKVASTEPCPTGQIRDCVGVCGGLARLDSCGACSGPNTGVVPEESRDVCGVCFGFEVDMDDCGICFGGNQAKDACGVCFGDGSSCAGCDGVPLSGLVVDACGVCGGNGSSCLGCNGEPMYDGGLCFGVCGWCNGEWQGINQTEPCTFDCTGMARRNSTLNVVYDCAGVCGGTAVIDECGVCSGGTTEIVPGFHNEGCGCFTPCSRRCEVDECGVCDGDNSTCHGCDNSPRSALVFDVCGVCGGNETDTANCAFDCLGILGGTAVYDCSGVCNGSAAVDDCGVCTGGSTGFSRNFHNDTCGVCFGGDALLDSCGVCGGDDSSRDDCGICFGSNANMDECGVCFGSNRRKDQCGVCFGNSTTCLGCDGVPLSGRTDCNNGEVPPPTSPSESDRSEAAQQRTSTLVIAAAVAATIVVVGVPVAIVVIRNTNLVRVTPLHDKNMPPAPTKDLAIVFTDIEGRVELWEERTTAMAEAVGEHNAVVRRVAKTFNGYEVKTDGDAFMLAFPSVDDAVEFCLAVQDELMEVAWSSELTSHPAAVVKAAVGGQVVFRGLRVKMGINYGSPETRVDKRSLRMDYMGGCVNLAARVCSVSCGGQILLSSEAFAKIQGSAALKKRVEMVSVGDFSVKGIKDPITLYQVNNFGLSGRDFGGEEALSTRESADSSAVSRRTFRRPLKEQGSLLDQFDEVMEDDAKTPSGGLTLSVR